MEIQKSPPVIRVLAVERQEDVISEIADFFSGIPECSLLFCSSFKEALERVPEVQPHLILLACTKTGSKQLAELRKQCPSAYLLASVRELDGELMHLCRRAGANDCIGRDSYYPSNLRRGLKKALVQILLPTLEGDTYDDFSDLLAILNAFQIGDTILRYRILEELDPMRLSQTYKAEDLQDGRPVAIKILPARVRKNETLKQRIIKDIEAAQQVRDSHLASIYSIEETSDLMLIVKEYVEGDSLRSLMERGRMGLVHMLDLGAQIADALEVVHTRSEVHGDIQPERIIVTPEGQAKLIDFGLRMKNEPHTFKQKELSEPLSFLTGETSMMQVLHLSPEQAGGEEMDARSDLFSLGSVLYHAVTGRPPFQGGDALSTMLEIITEDVVPPSTIHEDVTPFFDLVIQRALAKDKNQRYECAYDLAYALRMLKVFLVHGMPVSDITKALTERPAASVPAPLSPEAVVPHAKREHRVLIVLGTVLVTVLAALLYLMPPRKQVTLSLLVLPLSNEASDPEMEFVSDGITEGIVNDLSRLSSLRVISCDTVFRYRNSSLTPKEIGDVLKVDVVVAGRVAQGKGAVTVNTELINVSQGSTIWSKQYNLKRSDLQTTQVKITDEILQSMQLPRIEQPAKRTSILRITDNRIQQVYLKARSYVHQGTPDSLKRSLKLYRELIPSAPDFAEVYAGFAEALIYPPKSFAASQEAYSDAKDAAQKAIEMDPALPEAHAALGAVDLFYDWNFLEAEKELRKAITLRPNYSIAHSHLAILLAAANRPEEAYQEIQRAVALDPLSDQISYQYLWVLVQLRRYEEAIQEAYRHAERGPNSFIYEVMGDAYQGKGSYSEATRAYRFAQLFGSENGPIRIAAFMVATGMAKEARLLLGMEEKRQDAESLNPDSMAKAYVALGDKNEAIKWLSKAYELRSPELIMLGVDPAFDPLRSDFRFEKLLRLIGLATLEELEEGRAGTA